MARVEKSAAEVEVGDSVHFPNSRRPQVVSQVVSDESGTVHIIAEGGTAKWMMAPETTVACEVEDEPDAEG